MEKELPDEPQTDGGAAHEAPAVVLPSPNTQGVTGNLQGVASGINPIAPQPLISPLDSAGDDGLASRVEAALTEDGRFTALVSALLIGTAEDGTIRLSGPIPSESQRHSLLSAIRAVPGVTSVEDDLQVE